MARTQRLAVEVTKVDTGGLAFAWSLGYGPGSTVRAAIHSEQRPRALATYDAARCSLLLADLAQNATWQTATLFNNQRVFFRVDRMVSVRSASRYVPTATWKSWEDAARESQNMAPDARTAMELQGQWCFKLVRDMREANVGLWLEPTSRYRT